MTLTSVDLGLVLDLGRIFKFLSRDRLMMPQLVCESQLVLAGESWHAKLWIVWEARQELKAELADARC